MTDSAQENMPALKPQYLMTDSSWCLTLFSEVEKSDNWPTEDFLQTHIAGVTRC